jgi:CheY-like chemotaxis protein
MLNDKLHILYIDDDIDDHLFFKLAIENAPIPTQLKLALNGKEALDELLTMPYKPTHIFLDLSMPIMDGLDFLKEKNKDDEIRDIPTYVYSTSSRSLDISRALELGAERFFTKPNQVENIRKILEDTIYAEVRG